jgi:gamma-glutamyltranspeptidase/glutathione hydrolase
VVLNDQLDDFTTKAAAAVFATGAGATSSDVPRASSLGDGPNEPRAFARPTSSMTPTIVIRDGLPVLAVGGSGGLRIATGVAQALLARLVFQLPVRDCVALPRVHTPMDEARAVLELDEDTPDALVADLHVRGESVRRVHNYSAVQMVSIERGRDGAIAMDAAADPRKGGDALVE